MLKRIPNIFVLIFSLIAVAAALTWLIPGGQFIENNDGSLIYTSIDSSPQSWQIFTAFQKGFSKQSSIIIFVLIIGGVFWIFNSTKAIDVGINTLLSKLRRLENKRFFSERLISQLILILIMLVFSVFGAIFGMSEETIAFVGIVIPLAISLGYDSITGVCMVFVAAGLGFAGAILNPFTIGIAQEIAEIPMFSGIEYRLFCWLVINLVGISYVVIYANKIHKTPEKSPVYENDEYWRNRNDKKTTVTYHTPKRAWIVFILSLITLSVFSILYPQVDIVVGKTTHTLPALIISSVLYLITSVLTLRKSVHFYILNILFFIIILLTIGVMGFEWYINEISALFLAGGIMAGIAFGRSNSDIVKQFTEGAKDILSAALVIGLAAGIIVILEEGGIINTILHSAAGIMVDFGKVTSIQFMYILQTLVNIFIPSGSTQAAITMPLLAPLSELVGISKQAAVMAFQLGDGFTNMITPTSAVLLAVLGVAKIPYVKWIKWVAPFIAILVIVGALLLIPTVMMELNGF